MKENITKLKILCEGLGAKRGFRKLKFISIFWEKILPSREEPLLFP